MNTGITTDRFSSEMDIGLVTVWSDKLFKVDKKRNQKDIRDTEVYNLIYESKNCRMNVLTFNYITSIPTAQEAIRIVLVSGSNEDTK